MSKEALTDDGLKVLKNVWEDDVGEVQNILRTSWLNDPFTKGAYSFPRVDNSEKDFENLAEPIEIYRISCNNFFTGIRAAKEVLCSILYILILKSAT